MRDDPRLLRHATLYAWAATQLRSGLVLDLGCEFGFGAALLREANPALHVVSVDRDSRYVQIAYDLLQDATMPVVQADARALPLATNALQGACLINLVHLIPEPLVVLREVARVVAQGNPVLLSVPLDDDLPPTWRGEPVERRLLRLCRKAFASLTVPLAIEGLVPGAAEQSFAVGPGSALLVVEAR